MWLIWRAMGPLSLDLRVRILEAYERGEGSVRELAERFGVVPATVQNWRVRWRITGSVLPRPHAGGTEPKIESALLQQLLEEKNDRTLDELAIEYAARHGGVRVARSTMCEAVRRLEWTRKRKTLRASEQDRPDVQRARADFADDAQAVSPPASWCSSTSSAPISAWFVVAAGPGWANAPSELRR